MLFIILLTIFFNHTKVQVSEAAEIPVPTKELAGYLSTFVRESRGVVKLRDLTDSEYVFKRLAWEPGDGGTIADCVAPPHALPFVIHLDSRYWKKSTRQTREAIMFHELGHCACGRDHTYAKSSKWLIELLERVGFHVEHAHKLLDGCPDSVMNWTVPKGGCWMAHRDWYMKELFRKCTPSVREIPEDDR